MDLVTQTVLGATIGGVFRPRLGGKAVAVGAVCGASPDLDVLMRFTDDWGMLLYHRGPTHSLLVLTLAAPIVGWIAYRLSGKEHYWGWTSLAFLALVTHALLDWCTPYGTQLFWPLTSRRFSIDSVPVIDPIYTIPLLIATLISFVPRWSPRASQRAAFLSLALSTLYLGLGYVQSQRALSYALPQLRSEGFQAVDVRATPTMFNIWLRRDRGSRCGR